MGEMLTVTNLVIQPIHQIAVPIIRVSEAKEFLWFFTIFRSIQIQNNKKGRRALGVTTENKQTILRALFINWALAISTKLWKFGIQGGNIFQKNIWDYFVFAKSATWSW